jgi:hypothetical protein
MLRREFADANATAEFATALFMGGIRALPNLSSLDPSANA